MSLPALFQPHREAHTMNNLAAFRMIEGRLSSHVQLFNSYKVNEEDSDTQYFLTREKLALAKAALENAPTFKVTTLARSLGDVYLAVKRNLSDADMRRWIEINELLEALSDKYEGNE
jgi:hypothetical protein